jgi:DNA (cytosine-5)-methyltransferase 1
MRFIDLFAGIGGFHLALRSLGHECVFAAEIDDTLRQLYERNFDLPAAGDLRSIGAAEIPNHDVLCAGFPCQPFSKAKKGQPGLDEPKLGDLYLQIHRVVSYHHPQFLILENVPNLEKHDDGQTWEEIRKLFEAEGYHISIKKLSPHEFGIPQIRERIYIIGSLAPLNGFRWPEKTRTEASIHSILDKHPPEARRLPEQVSRCLDVWQEFLDRVPKNEKVPHPLWSMEFGATYPYQLTTPHAMDLENLRRYRGAHGRPLSAGKTEKQVFDLLPSHARTEQVRFPRWKIKFIHKNREFYECHKGWLSDWIERIRVFPSSFQKLEWNCQEKDLHKEIRHIDRCVVQFRPSGVRVKRPTTAPSLVAMTATQVPIITWEERYMTPTECKRLQSMDNLKYLPERATKAYEALGNAVNVEIAKLVAEALLNTQRNPPLEEDNTGWPKNLSHLNDATIQNTRRAFEIPCTTNQAELEGIH